LSKACVTGGAGFIGSHVVDGLIREGWEVFILDDLSTGKSENVNSKARFYKIDIRSHEVGKVFRREKPQLIFHLAAQIDVRKAAQDPEFDAGVNVLGTLNLLRAAVEFDIKKLIFSSTGGAIYGEVRDGAAVEGRLPLPGSPYGISKLAGEHYVRFYGESQELKYSVLRYGNVYGPRQDPLGEAGVVAIFSQAMLAQKSIVLYGHGKMERDYVYVEDVVEANLLAIERGHGEALNIGTGKATSVNELFSVMKQCTGYALQSDLKEKRYGELWRSCLDCTRAQSVLGWRAKTRLRSGIEKTLEWFKSKRD
jgi:UDP-glucose 4-epimerase